MFFICPHCGAIAADATGIDVLEYGCTLICDECGGMAVITITKRPNTCEGSWTYPSRQTPVALDQAFIRVFDGIPGRDGVSIRGATDAWRVSFSS